MTQPLTHPVLQSPLSRVIDEIRSETQRGLPALRTAEEVARRLRNALTIPDLLTVEQQRSQREHYTQHLLHAEPDGSFSVVALVWLPGQTTAIHDHVSWCTVGVYQGCETEIRYQSLGTEPTRTVVEVDRGYCPTGSVSAIAPPGDIHRVFNTGPGKAISLHVYGADIARLGSSIYRTYRSVSAPGMKE